uniref:Uncharacterized protein n=1 Tax=Parascaris equorum TaxID=6256 RepID=A0A914RDQ8_PAREQ
MQRHSLMETCAKRDSVHRCVLTELMYTHSIFCRRALKLYQALAHVESRTDAFKNERIFGCSVIRSMNYWLSRGAVSQR